MFAMNRTDSALLRKNILFLIIIPGTVTGYVPFGLLPGSFLPAGWHTIIGVLVVFPGVLIVVSCVRRFWKEGRGTPAPIAPPSNLVVGGLYRYIRNPMYAGVLLILAGESICFRSAVHAVYTTGAAIFFTLFIVLYEEPKLKKLFGPAYTEYIGRVPRWIPKVGRLLNHGDRMKI